MRPIIEIRDVSKRFGSNSVVRNVSFTVEDGQSVCLLGPSGCGKTTTLRIIAGLETPDSGSIVIDGVDVSHRPPYARNIGLVFQDYALFPHMTVAQNVAFGLRHRGVAKTEIAPRVSDVLSLVKLSGFEARRPGQLSGGEQQRVALARALVTRPMVLLLDEPLSNLDAKLRADLRVQLHAILAAVRTTTIMVTHDQDEAMSLADRIVVMSRGAIEQSGRPVEIYDAPCTRFVAEFIGRSNWLSGRIVAAADAHGLARFALDGGGSVLVVHPAADAAEGYDLCLRPERLAVSLAGAASPIADGSAVNRLKGRVRFVEMLGPQLHLHVVLEGGGGVLALMPRSNGQDFTGAEIDLAFRAEDALLIPRAPSVAGDRPGQGSR